jgi:hypothetical protein
MPQLKQPLTLQEIGIRLYVKKYCDKCKRWMDLLHTLPRETVLKESCEMQEEISKLMPWILKLLSPRLAKKFLKLIYTYDSNSSSRPRNVLDTWTRVTLCKAIFRSVLTRFVQKVDTSFCSYLFIQIILLQNLDSLPGLLDLSIRPSFASHLGDHLGLMSSKIHHLTNLQIFKYPCHCTDEIILQLQLNCPRLKVIEINDSKEVTNASVQHLMELRGLKFLDLCGTQIDDEHYGLILTELPNIANIKSRGNENSILRHITMKSLDTITHLSGSFQDIEVLIQKCPNTTNIELLQNCRDLSRLTAFNALRVLKIVSIDYGKSNLNAVLRDIGHRLTELNLIRVKNLDLQDIIILCPSLEDLSLIDCTCLYLNTNKPFDPQLPHFRNLIYLVIEGTLDHRVDFGYIRYYISLKTIYLGCAKILTVEFVRGILNLGTYKQLEVFRIEEYCPQYLNERALQLLIMHCPLLKRVELSSCQDLPPNPFREIKRQILLQNLDLKFKEYHTTHLGFFTTCYGCYSKYGC